MAAPISGKCEDNLSARLSLSAIASRYGFSLRGNVTRESNISAQAAGMRAGMRVLLIEDDSGTAKSIERMLKAAAFHVSTTDLGKEGIDLGEIYDYDIILLDLN